MRKMKAYHLKDVVGKTRSPDTLTEIVSRDWVLACLHFGGVEST